MYYVITNFIYMRSTDFGTERTRRPTSRLRQQIDNKIYDVKVNEDDEDADDEHDDDDVTFVFGG